VAILSRTQDKAMHEHTEAVGAGARQDDARSSVEAAEEPEPPGDEPMAAHTPQGVRPRWDKDNREFLINDVLVKRYKHRARSQTAVLATFEECNWAARVDTPLRNNLKTHQALKALNKLAPGKIRFRSDGTGEGIRWESVDSEATEKVPE
jgi:hypothetical protein